MEEKTKTKAKTRKQTSPSGYEIHAFNYEQLSDLGDLILPYYKNDMKAEYFDPDKALEKGKTFNIIISNRSSGKTHNILLKALVDALKGKGDFALIRSLKEDIDATKSTVFDAICRRNFPDLPIEIKPDKFGRFLLSAFLPKEKYIVRAWIGYFMALTGSSSAKGGSYNTIKTIIYDEAFPEGTPLSNQKQLFQSLLLTIGRDRTDYKVWILGNALRTYAPLYGFFGITRAMVAKQNEIKTKNTYYLKFVNKITVAKMAKTALGQLLAKDEDYGKMSLTNEVSEDIRINLRPEIILEIASRIKAGHKIKDHKRQVKNLYATVLSLQGYSYTTYFMWSEVLTKEKWVCFTNEFMPTRFEQFLKNIREKKEKAGVLLEFVLDELDATDEKPIDLPIDKSTGKGEGKSLITKESFRKNFFQQLYWQNITFASREAYEAYEGLKH